ncbi:MAG: GAF domain-containing protein, partial [bacterium]|nr:GAF domain-containing protein [bacterium]
MDNERAQLIDNIRIAIAGEKTVKEILESAVELIDSFSEDFNWTGFYMLRDGALEVGPYVGPKTEHTRIAVGQGICGAAAEQKETIVVDDVTGDPRFLACSLSTRSEIVVPLMDGDRCLGQIDIDSDRSNNFNADDRRMLEEIA